MEFKIAVVGCSGFGNVHLEALRELGYPFYVFSRSKEKAEECAKKYNALGFFTSYKDVIKSDADIVDLIVSHDSHYPMTVAALEAGKHVMLEKPIARTEEEAIGMIKIAKELGLKFMVLENFYFDSTVWAAKKEMEKLGKISLIIVRSTHFNSPGGWRAIKEKMGGGAFIDGGVHFVDTILNLGGDYEQVKAYCNKYFSGIEGEDTTLALFKFRSGASGVMIYSWSAKHPPRVPAFEIYGENGSIIEDPSGRINRKPFGNLIVNVSGEAKVVEVEKRNPIVEEIRGFVEAVSQNKEVPMQPEIALRDLKAVLTVYKECGEI